MNQEANFKNQLLIAMPSLKDPDFERTVTYICDHSAEGAMGIIINRPMDITLGKVLDQLDIENEDPNIDDQPVMAGGPMGVEQGFILHQPDNAWKTSFINSDEIAITTSRDILQAIANGKGPQKTLMTLGYAGWSAGQLEQEIVENAWLSIPATQRLIFDYPYYQRWEAAISSMGFDVAALSSEAGHA